MTDELAFKVVRINGTYDVLSRCVNLIIARGAYREAARMYPEDALARSCSLSAAAENRSTSELGRCCRKSSRGHCVE
jgi:hypothetical protein